MVEWSSKKERINERGTYIFVKWSCTNKICKSVWTLSLGRMVVHKKESMTEDHIFRSNGRVHIKEINH